MWFVLLAIALAIVGAGGWYVRRRILEAATTFDVRRRPRRIIGWLIPWLLYGYPIIVFVAVFASIALGSETIKRSPTGFWEWILVYPFWWAVLVMLQCLPWLFVLDLLSAVLRSRWSSDRRRRARATTIAVIVALFAVYTPARILWERGDLRARYHSVDAGHETSAPLKLVFVSDLQQDDHTDQPRVDEVIKLVNNAGADIVLSGGDWINSGTSHVERAARSAGRLESRLGTFSVQGDHENFVYRDRQRSVSEMTAALEREGVHMRENRVELIEHEDRRVAIIYLTYNYLYRSPDREIEALLTRATSADYIILVAHQLDEPLAQLIRDRVDLALVGHTHGGQVNPVVGFLHTSVARVETPYVTGRYHLSERTTLIVTSGIGFSIAPFRYASPATLEVIDLWL